MLITMNSYIPNRKRVTDISGNLTRYVVPGREGSTFQSSGQQNITQITLAGFTQKLREQNKGSQKPLIGKENHRLTRAEHSLREKILIKSHAREVDETTDTPKPRVSWWGDGSGGQKVYYSGRGPVFGSQDPGQADH